MDARDDLMMYVPESTPDTNTPRYPNSTARKKRESDLFAYRRESFGALGAYALLFSTMYPEPTTQVSETSYVATFDVPLQEHLQEHSSPIHEAIEVPSFNIQQPRVPVDPVVQARTIRYGLLNLVREPFASAPARDSQVIASLRLNMINLYLKYVIQALLYLLIAYLLWLTLSFCFQAPAFILIPLTILAALHLAARRMHQPDHALHDPDGYRFHSLTGPYDLVSNTSILIDKIANHSVRFFSGITTRLAATTVLDTQISYVPDNRFEL